MNNIYAIMFFLKKFRFVSSSEVFLLFFLRFEHRLTHIVFIYDAWCGDFQFLPVNVKNTKYGDGSVE